MRYDRAFYDRGYHTALLTTFSFDPTVFENVPLVAMWSRGVATSPFLPIVTW